MCRYDFPSYATIYNATVNSNKELYSYVGRHACYGDSLARMSGTHNDASYHIILVRDDSWVKRHYKNQCRMSKHQVENYLRRIKSIQPFKYSVKEGEFEGAECFHLYLKMTDVTKKQATFVLQCVKRIYEWPYCFFLEQALQLQRIPKYKHDSILNLFNVTYSTFYDSQNTDHCFSGNAKFEKYSTIREKLPHVKYTSDVYPTDGGPYKPAKSIKGISYAGCVPNTPSQWTPELFQALLPYYVENYNRLKR